MHENSEVTTFLLQLLPMKTGQLLHSWAVQSVHSKQKTELV